jgi:hypothetical protein
VAQDRSKRKTVDAGMKEGRIEVDRVAVPPPLLAHVKHSGVAQIADEAPNGTLRESHRICDFVDGTARMDGDVEENSTVAGNEIEVSDEAPLI